MLCVCMWDMVCGSVVGEFVSACVNKGVLNQSD